MITVLGATGFLGARFVARLVAEGVEHQAPPKDAPLSGRVLGTVIDCVGVTSDFRSRPLDTVEAHVSHAADFLRASRFDRLVYLSSTRVYRRAKRGTDEDAALSFRPTEPEDLYDLSKAMGEATVLAASQNGVVVRLSNVYGPSSRSGDFLPAILDAAAKGSVVFQQALGSEKDYVNVEDVVDVVLRIARGSKERVYNIAAGENVSHRAIAERLQELTGCAVGVVPGAPTVKLPRCSIQRVRAEFGFEPRRLLDDLPALLAARSGKAS